MSDICRSYDLLTIEKHELVAEIERLKIACRDQAGVELSEENDRLIAEIERLTAEIRDGKSQSKDAIRELRAEIERLRSALDRAADALEFYDNKAEAQLARGALEDKPWAKRNE